MTTKASAWTAMGGGVLVVLGAVVGVQACGIESPVTPQTEVVQSSVAAPAPAPASAVLKLRKGPVLTPYTQAPQMINREEVMAALQKAYPAELRMAGVVGTAAVYLLIDEGGAVANALIEESSGQPALDEGALQVARVMRFQPARNGEAAVPVWVKLPITFQMR